MKKRILSISIVVCVLFCSIPVLADNYINLIAANGDVQLCGISISDLKNKFPNGSYWNHPNGSNNPDGYSWTPCTHHYINCNLYGNCACNSFSNAIQCHGFALKLGYDYYGSNPRSWTKVYNLNSLKAGDIIRYDKYNKSTTGHSVWVTNVSGSSVTVAECNRGSNCNISWGRTLDKSQFNDLDYVLSAPYAASDNSTPDTSCRFQVTATDGINIRSGAGTNNGVVGAIPYQAYFVITERASADGYTWGKTTYNGVSGWCVLDFAKHISGTLPPLNNTSTPTPTPIPTYTITYNANGGSGAPSAQTKTHNVTLGLSTTKPTRTGYTFLGWSKTSTASTASYQPGASFTDNANTTLYAVWRINTYTITYNVNGGTGDIKPQTKTHGTAITLTDKTPTREGYTFLGWAKSSSATSAVYQPTSTFGENADTTLFAVWKINTFTVTFNANGGINPPEAQTKIYGTALTLTKTRPTRANYSFEGWNTKADGTGTTYAAGDSYTENSAVTLYAIWDPNATSVTLDPNGGIWNNSAEMQMLWNKYARTEELETPKRDGFELAGFTLDSTSDAVVYPYGWSLFTDTKFENGMNGMEIYNNSGNGSVDLEKVAVSADCPTKADYMIKIQTIGKSAPSYGGFVQYVNSKPNGVFYQVILAKIPKGYCINHAANQLGDYSDTLWLTSNQGTGEWETYILKRSFGMSGTFHDFGYVFISDSEKGWYAEEIDVATPENPLTWYVAYANIFDATDLSNHTKDPWFYSSLNGAIVYNNAQNGSVTVTRELVDEPTQKYDLKITTNGMAAPSYGGFIIPTSAQPNHIYYHYIRAKIPKGYAINYAHNLGDNAKFTWLTSNYGTGSMQDYIYKVECTENVSDFTWGFGHVFLTKNENIYKNGTAEIVTTEEPLTWYVEYSDIFDMTPQYTYGESGKLTARWSLKRCAVAKPNITYGSMILSQTPVTLSCDVEGADIYYTTDGSYPTVEKGNLYTGAPIYLPAGETTLRTIAVNDGYSTSYERSYLYTVYENAPETSTAVATTSTFHSVISEITNPIKGVYIFAVYDSNGTLLDTVIKDITDSDTLLDFKINRIENADHAKVFIWSSISEMQPFMEAEIVDF